MPRKIFLLAVYCLLSFTAAHAQQCEDTPTPLGARWHPDVPATLAYRPGDFTADERRALSLAVADWQALLKRLGLRITLTEGVEGNILVVRDRTMRDAGELRGVASGNYFTSAVVRLRVVRRGVMAHELGHAFGLNDCPRCGGRSIMTDYSRGKRAPTSCDEVAVGAFYAAEEETAAGEVKPEAGARLSLTPPAPGDGHPSEEQLYQRQGEYLRRMASVSFTREMVSSAGWVVRTRLYSGENRLQRAPEDAPRVAEGDKVKVSRLNSGQLFLPPFVYAPRYLGRDGSLYVYQVTGRLDGRVWTDGEGNVVRAEGLGLCPDLKDGEQALRFVYEAKAGRPQRASVDQEIKDKHGRGHSLRLRVRFYDYKEHKGAEPEVLDVGDVEEQ